MFDYLPCSLGIEIEDKFFHKILSKNTPLPARASQSITTLTDNQFSIEIHLLKGDSRLIEKNKTLGRFVLSGLKERKKYSPKIDFSISVKPNGLITLQIVDQVSQKELVQVLSIESYDELFNLNFQSDDMKHRKKRLKNVINCLSEIIYKNQNMFNHKFISESFENLAIAREALIRNKTQAILEMALILETLIAEAEAIERIRL